VISIKKNTVNLIIRITVSVCALWYLFTKIDLHGLKNALNNFNPAIYFLAFLVILLHQAVWAYTWKITLEEKNVKIKFTDIYRAVLTSYFFGTFLPSSLGPDIILTFNIGRSLPEKQHAPSSLLFIRIMNTAAILLVSGLALLFMPKLFVIRQILVLTWLLMLSVWICYWIAVHPFVRKIFERVLSKYPKSFNIVYKIFFSFTTFGLDQKALIKIWTGGLIMALLKVLIDYTTARSLGAHIPYLWFLSFIPSVSIISMIPISIAGLGIREGAYVALFAALGVSSGISLSISLTVFSLNLLLCVIGGVLYLIHGAYLKLKNI
jgi:uncharacterized protein (TIRG00374 family)